jgi:hypothetical protein
MRNFLISAITALVIPATANAQTTMIGTISMLRTGWGLDAFAVVTVETRPNPARCANPDGYISAKGFPGYNTYYAAALTAFAINRRASLVISDTECYLDRPKLIGINLLRE